MSSKYSSQDSSIFNLLNTLVKRVSDSGEQADESSLLDTSLSVAREFIERQALGGISLIRSSDTVDDFVAIKGAPVELSLEVDRAQALANVKVFFFVDDSAVNGTGNGASPGPERKARTRYVPNEAGCFPVTCTIRSKSGLDISDDRTKKNVLLHVFDKKPVVCVDAGLITTRKGKIDEQLAKLAAEGFDIVYVDFGDEDRVEKLRKIRQRRSLPMGALIPLTDRIRQFESFDVDFKQSLMGLAVNRLRAMGAPVVGLITTLDVDHHYSFPSIEVFKEINRLSDAKLIEMKSATKRFIAKRNRYWENGRNTIEWRVNEMVPGTWFKRNQYEIELNNKLARLKIFDAIDTATKQVDLQFYIFKESRFAHELGVRLAKAAERGVQVRLMVDAVLSGENFLSSWNSFLKRIGKVKGIHVVAADAITLTDDWDAAALRQRDHRKLIIIDGLSAFVGGRNGSDEYYYDWSEVPIADWTAADNIPWLDAHVQFEGPLVKEVQDLFDKTWKRNGGKQKAKIRRAGVKPASTEVNTEKQELSRARLVVHEGTHDANGLAAYESLICGAQKKLMLVNDFPVLDDIAEMLIQAVRRGVKVTFITGSVLARRVDGSFFDGGRHRELFEYVVKSRLGELVDAGVEVYEFQTPLLDNVAVKGGRIRPYVHAKLITADSRYVSLGSANLDITASYWEREANVFIDDISLVKSLDRKLGAMAKSGIKIDTASAQWKREAPQREVVSRLWPDSFLN